MSYAVDSCHEQWLKEHKPQLAFSRDIEYEPWREEVRAMLKNALGNMPDMIDINPKLEYEKEFDTFIERRIIISSEKYIDIPCHIWIPKNIKTPAPAIICLQGHSSGMHISMGRPKYEGDEEVLKSGDRDFAVRAVNEGYIALCLDQRGFGERFSEAGLKFIQMFMPNERTSCDHAAHTAMLLGRTLIGERVWDISRAIDLLETLPEADKDRIAVMGNSGGGTASYYAACIDERIKAVMPSCSVCSYQDSIVWKHHCACNYIPGIARYVDMGELACLIAPRPLVVVAGQTDIGFHIDGVHKVYETIEAIYQKVGAEKNCRLVVGSEGHRFYAKPGWEAFNQLTGWRG